MDNCPMCKEPIVESKEGRHCRNGCSIFTANLSDADDRMAFPERGKDGWLGVGADGKRWSVGTEGCYRKLPSRREE